MKKLNSLKLHRLQANQVLDNLALRNLKGGYDLPGIDVYPSCSCSCWAANQGGSSTSGNGGANKR